MLHLFFKKNELENLHILGSAIYNLNTSHDFVSKHILSEKSTIQHNIKQLNDNLARLGHSSVKVRSIGNRIVLEGKKEEFYNNLLFDLSCDYVQKSPIYTLFKLMSYNVMLDKNTVGEEAHISQSYLAKLMANINAFLAPTRVKLITRKGKLFYSGPVLDKLYVDYLIQRFLLFFQSYDQIIYSEQEASFNFFPNKFEQRKSIALTKLLEVHTDAKNDYLTDPHIIQLLKEFRRINDVHAGKSPELDSEQISLVVNLMTRLSSDHIDTDEQRTLISLALWEKQQAEDSNPLLNDIIYITDEICEQFDESKQTLSKFKLNLIYLITLKMINYHLFQCNLEKSLDFTPAFIKETVPSVEKKTDAFITSLANDSNLMPLTQDMLLEFKYEITNDIKNISNIKTVPIKIFINITYQLSRKKYIINRISRLFSTDSVIITDYPDEADMFVCDYLIPKRPDASFFFLADAESNDSVDLLLNFITTKYNELNMLN